MSPRFKPTASALCFIASLWVLHAQAQQPPIRVEDAWIRWLPAGVPAAGYATFTNASDKSIALTLASSSAYGEISMHRSVNTGSTVSMQPAKEIIVAGHSSLELEKAGYHFMLMSPKTPIKRGDRIPITLTFSDGSSVTARFDVK